MKHAFIICLILGVLVMDRPAKLARLEEFRRSKPSCSASALSAMLGDVAKNGSPPSDKLEFPETCTKHCHELRDALWTDLAIYYSHRQG